MGILKTLACWCRPELPVDNPTDPVLCRAPAGAESPTKGCLLTRLSPFPPFQSAGPVYSVLFSCKPHWHSAASIPGALPWSPSPAPGGQDGALLPRSWLSFALQHRRAGTVMAAVYPLPNYQMQGLVTLLRMGLDSRGR